MTRVRSPSTTFWLPILPPGSRVGLEMTSGPLPGEPPTDLGNTSRGLAAEPATAEGLDLGAVAEPQAAASHIMTVHPPSTASFQFLVAIVGCFAQTVPAWKAVTVAVPDWVR